MIMDRYRLFRFTCGHVGRVNEGVGQRAKVEAFIRVGQVGSSPVSEALKPCPECNR